MNQVSAHLAPPSVSVAENVPTPPAKPPVSPGSPMLRSFPFTQ